MKVIIFPNETGIAVMTPTGELSDEETAKKDVPTGFKYKIVEDSDVSTDRSFRDAWTVDESELTDGVGA